MKGKKKRKEKRKKREIEWKSMDDEWLQIIRVYVHHVHACVYVHYSVLTEETGDEWVKVPGLGGDLPRNVRWHHRELNWVLLVTEVRTQENKGDWYSKP